MNGFRTETRKLTTLRLPWVVLAVAAVLAAALGVLNVHALADTTRVTVTDVAVGVAEPAWFLVILVAVLAAASEFQHSTVVTTLLATPRRPVVLASKAAASAGYGIVLTTVAAVTAVVAGVVTAAVEDLPLHLGTGRELAGAVGAVVLGGLWAVLASALGLLARSTAVALTAVLLWKFVLEGIVPVVSRTPELSDWLPSGAAAAVIGADGAGLSALVGAVVVAGYAAVLTLLAGASFVRRDPL